jgi:hypothetical protein
MKRALVALLSSIVLAGTALAADLPLPAPLPSARYFPAAMYTADTNVELATTNPAASTSNV